MFIIFHFTSFFQKVFTLLVALTLSCSFQQRWELILFLKDSIDRIQFCSLHFDCSWFRSWHVKLYNNFFIIKHWSKMNFNWFVRLRLNLEVKFQCVKLSRVKVDRMEHFDWSYVSFVHSNEAVDAILNQFHNALLH